MFYSQFILAKKGPLGTIWIAAHLERKLRKNQVTETNIGVSVDSILFPEVPIALRLSGHLLLGVVRIYSRKVNYLFHDCSEALVKIKQAFHSGAVDLPPEAATAPIHAITLPENFDLDDLELLPDREALFLANSSIDHHVTSREQITLQDTVDDTAYASQFGLDERLDAPRLEFDEDVIPVKSREDVDNSNARLDQEEEEEEDILPVVDDDNQLDDDKLEEPMVPETADTQMQDLPDLNEEHPAEVEAMDLESVDASNAVGETPAVPDMVSSEDTGEKQPAGVTVPEDEQKSEESPVVEHEDLPAENQAVIEDREASTGGDDTVDKINEDEIRVADIDKPNEDKETLETQKSSENGVEEAHLEAMQDVPEIEKVRSAADVSDMDPSVLPEVLDSTLHEDPKEAEETPALKHDGQPDVEETPILKQDAPSEVRTSPRVSEFGGDDDMLASILGRRSLKVAPTPDLPPAKRQKPGLKPVVSKKRKVQMDESTVLHSDNMKHQLSDTYSIRRVRKRAPCSEYEIWSAEREVQGQLMFEEPVVLGFCENVRELYRSLWDAKRPVEPEAGSLSAKQKHQLDYEETEEAITLAEEQLDDYAFDDMQRRYPFEELSVAEERDSTAAPATSSKETQVVEAATSPQQADVPGEESKEKSPATEQVDVTPTAETEVDNRAGEQSPAAAPVLEDHTLQDVSPPGSAESPLKNGEELQAEHTEVELSKISTPPEPEVPQTVEDAEMETHAEKTPQNEESIQEEDILEQGKVADTNVDSVQLEEQAPEVNNHGDSAAEGLGFLTDAKDDEADDGENGESEYVELEVQDNSGWSVRTRAVCQYLRMTFENMESSRKEEQVPVKIGLERLLQGKTRRESARMFFESLVLKTKDYINIEQDRPFDNIYITARSKLMKVDL